MRSECVRDAQDTREEEDQLCADQLAGRLDACKTLREDRYDPDFDPTLFDTNFANPSNPNPFFPLTIGNTWEYRGGTESNTIKVLNKTKLIDGVTCLVVRDTVKEEGKLKPNWTKAFRNSLFNFFVPAIVL
ncbi:MAG TPA: hypothetical protein VJ521_16195 [Acidobacteriota bacterium]|nr:hypothetical protein [Acidobacteriota bacterium]